MRPFVTKTLYKTLPWVVPILLLFIWQLTSKVGILSAKTLAAPSDVLLAAVELTQSGELFDHVWVSLGRALIGFCDWRRYRVHFRTRERIIPYIRTVTGYIHTDATEHSASGAHSTRHSLVRNRGRGKNIPRCIRGTLPNLH